MRTNIEGIAPLLESGSRSHVHRGTSIEIDDRFIGDGYGIPTEASREAIELAARTEAIFLDPVYTGKAMAGLIAYVRQQRFTGRPDGVVLAHRRSGGVVRVSDEVGLVDVYATSMS